MKKREREDKGVRCSGVRGRAEEERIRKDKRSCGVRVRGRGMIKVKDVVEWGEWERVGVRKVNEVVG